MIYISQIIIGFILIAVGIIGYLNSIVIEKTFIQIKTEVRGLHGELLGFSNDGYFFGNYEIVPKKGK